MEIDELEAEIEQRGHIDEELLRQVVEVIRAEMRLGIVIYDVEEFALAVYDELTEKRFGRFALTA